MDPNWQLTDRPCPQCGKPILRGDWWDDHPDNGGALIGHLQKCSDEACDYREQF